MPSVACAFANRRDVILRRGIHVVYIYNIIVYVYTYVYNIKGAGYSALDGQYNMGETEVTAQLPRKRG